MAGSSSIWPRCWITWSKRKVSSRGRPIKYHYCGCCEREYESLAHILHVCPRTHRSRVERHDSMLDCARALKDRDACVEREVHIPTQAGVRIHVTRIFHKILAIYAKKGLSYRSGKLNSEN